MVRDAFLSGQGLCRTKHFLLFLSVDVLLITGWGWLVDIVIICVDAREQIVQHEFACVFDQISVTKLNPVRIHIEILENIENIENLENIGIVFFSIIKFIE